jgi:hypothetical protein
MRGIRLIFVLLCFTFLFTVNTPAQSVSDYHYTLENGIEVVTDHGWNFVFIYEQTDEFDNKDQAELKLNAYAVGDMLAGENTFELLSAEGRRVPGLEDNPRVYHLGPGTYSAVCTLPLKDGAGEISFKINNIQAEAAESTTVSAVFNEVGITVEEEGDTKGGLAAYSAFSEIYAGERGPAVYPHMYKPGDHSQRLKPAESINDQTHRIGPGIYDLFLDMDISCAGFGYEIWLNNIELKEDTRTNVTVNLHGSEIEVRSASGSRPDMIHFYREGTADKIGLNEDKDLELYAIEGPGCECPAGTYDILLNYGYGERYEWKKSVKCLIGEKTLIELE